MEAFIHNQGGNPLDSYVNSICNQFQMTNFPPNLKKRKGDPLLEHHPHNTLQKSHSFSTGATDQSKNYAKLNQNDVMKFYTDQNSLVDNEINKNRYMVVLANQLSNSQNAFANAYSNMVSRNNNFVQPAMPTKVTTATVNKTSTTDGDYQIVVGESLNSLSDSYEVLSFLGRGTFGQVVKCVSKTEKKLFAIKILKNHPSYLRQGNVEIQILQALSRQDTEAHNIVRAIECFQHKQHMCLVFELLEQNLYEYLKTNRFKPLSLKEIRPITQQVLVALTQLKNLGLIHADLKPENIMLVYPSSNSCLKYKVKVIDFGSACYSSKTVQNTYLQSRYYRAPEILLGLPFNEAIDMWSLGCVVAELFLGWPLYPGSSEFDQIRYIVETQGLVPHDMIMNAGKGNRFFVKYPTTINTFNWRLKTHEEYFNDNGHSAKEARKYILSSLDQIREIGQLPYQGSPEFEIELEDRKKFAHLLASMLQIRPTDRIQPDAALMHPFITLEHYQTFPYTKKTHESVVLMQVCYHNKNSIPMHSLQVTPMPGGFLHPTATPHDHQHPFVMMNSPNAAAAVSSSMPPPNHIPQKNNPGILFQNQVAMNNPAMPHHRYSTIDYSKNHGLPPSRKIGVQNQAAAFSSFYDLMSAANCNNATAISLLLAAASKENNASTSKLKKAKDKELECYHQQQRQNQIMANNLIGQQQRASANYFNNPNNVNAYYESQTIPQTPNEAAALLLQQQYQQQCQNLPNYSHLTDDSMHGTRLNSKMNSSHTMPTNRQANKNMQTPSGNGIYDQFQNNRFNGNNAAFLQGILVAALAQQQQQQAQSHPQHLQNAQLFQNLLHTQPNQLRQQNTPAQQAPAFYSSNNSLNTANYGPLNRVSGTSVPSCGGRNTVIASGSASVMPATVNSNKQACLGSNSNYPFFDVSQADQQQQQPQSQYSQESYADYNQLCEHPEAVSLISNSASTNNNSVNNASPCDTPNDTVLQSMLLMQNHTHSVRGGQNFNQYIAPTPQITQPPPLNLSSASSASRGKQVHHPYVVNGHHSQYTSLDSGGNGGPDYFNSFDANPLDFQRLLEHQIKSSANKVAATAAIVNMSEYNSQENNLLHLLQQEAINQTKNQLKRLYPNLVRGTPAQQALAAQLLLEQKSQGPATKRLYDPHHHHHHVSQHAQQYNTSSIPRHPSTRSTKKSKDESYMMQRMMWSMLEHSWQSTSAASGSAPSSTPNKPQKRATMDPDSEPIMSNTRSAKKCHVNMDDGQLKSQSQKDLRAGWNNYEADPAVKTTDQKRITMKRPGNDKPIPVGRVQPMVKDQDNSMVFNSSSHSSLQPRSSTSQNNSQDDLASIGDTEQNLLTNYVLMQLRNQANNFNDNEVAPALLLDPSSSPSSSHGNAEENDESNAFQPTSGLDPATNSNEPDFRQSLPML